MAEPHKIWIEQCEAARGIREDFGTEKALGYLIGEKLLNFMRAAANSPDFERELPNFVAEIKVIFGTRDIRDYFENLRRIGVFGHLGDNDEVEELRATGMIHEEQVSGTAEVFLVKRMKRLLMA